MFIWEFVYKINVLSVVNIFSRLSSLCLTTSSRTKSNRVTTATDIYDMSFNYFLLFLQDLVDVGVIFCRPFRNISDSKRSFYKREAWFLSRVMLFSHSF